MGIVNAGQLAIYENIPTDLKDRIEDVIFNRHPEATEALIEIAEQYSGRGGQSVEADNAWRALPVEERLAHALIKGINKHIVADTEEARLNTERPIDVIEGPLMDGMNRVGDLLVQEKCSYPKWLRVLE